MPCVFVERVKFSYTAKSEYYINIDPLVRKYFKHVDANYIFSILLGAIYNEDGQLAQEFIPPMQHKCYVKVRTSYGQKTFFLDVTNLVKKYGIGNDYHMEIIVYSYIDYGNKEYPVFPGEFRVMGGNEASLNTVEKVRKKYYMLGDHCVEAYIKSMGKKGDLAEIVNDYFKAYNSWVAGKPSLAIEAVNSVIANTVEAGKKAGLPAQELDALSESASKLLTTLGGLKESAPGAVAELGLTIAASLVRFLVKNGNL